MNSVLQTKKECFFCKTTQNLHRHHVLYGSSNRKQAEKYGFTVYLCLNHHTNGGEAVHRNPNGPLDRYLKELAQKYWDIWEELPVNKFRNKKIFTKDGKFDSKREMHRYLELAAMQQAGKITGLERQAKYILIGSQKREDGTTERPVSYTADFRYTDKEGKIVVEDVKSPRTRKNPEYIIKRKLMLERYGITIREVA